MTNQIDGDSSIHLTGVRIASPLGFMAALGLMRVCAQDHGLAVRLAWHSSHAILYGITPTALVQRLVEQMRNRSQAAEFNFEVTDAQGRKKPVEHLREIPLDDFRTAVAQCQQDSRALGFLAGFATDAVISDKGFVARTQLDFTSGQQKLAVELRRLAQKLDPQTRRPRVALTERIERALFGGPYEDQSSLGWEPAAMMAHAHQPQAPTASKSPGQPMLIWLAIESMPLHPVLPHDAQHTYTVGFRERNAYVWPQWQEPLSWAEVTLLRQRPVNTLNDLPGVTAVWSSAVGRIGKYGILRPGART